MSTSTARQRSIPDVVRSTESHVTVRSSYPADDDGDTGIRKGHVNHVRALLFQEFSAAGNTDEVKKPANFRRYSQQRPVQVKPSQSKPQSRPSQVRPLPPVPDYPVESTLGYAQVGKPAHIEIRHLGSDTDSVKTQSNQNRRDSNQRRFSNLGDSQGNISVKNWALQEYEIHPISDLNPRGKPLLAGAHISSNTSLHQTEEPKPETFSYSRYSSDGNLGGSQSELRNSNFILQADRKTPEIVTTEEWSIYETIPTEKSQPVVNDNDMYRYSRQQSNNKAVNGFFQGSDESIQGYKKYLNNYPADQKSRRQTTRHTAISSSSASRLDSSPPKPVRQVQETRPATRSKTPEVFTVEEWTVYEKIPIENTPITHNRQLPAASYSYQQSSDRYKPVSSDRSTARHSSYSNLAIQGRKTPEMTTKEEWTVYEKIPYQAQQKIQKTNTQMYNTSKPIDSPKELFGSNDSVVGYKRYLYDDVRKPRARTVKQKTEYKSNATENRPPPQVRRTSVKTPEPQRFDEWTVYEKVPIENVPQQFRELANSNRASFRYQPSSGNLASGSSRGYSTSDQGQTEHRSYSSQQNSSPSWKPYQSNYRQENQSPDVQRSEEWTVYHKVPLHEMSPNYGKSARMSSSYTSGPRYASTFDYGQENQRKTSTPGANSRLQKSTRTENSSTRGMSHVERDKYNKTPVKYRMSEWTEYQNIPYDPRLLNNDSSGNGYLADSDPDLAEEISGPHVFDRDVPDYFFYSYEDAQKAQKLAQIHKENGLSSVSTTDYDSPPSSNSRPKSRVYKRAHLARYTNNI